MAATLAAVPRCFFDLDEEEKGATTDGSSTRGDDEDSPLLALLLDNIPEVFGEEVLKRLSLADRAMVRAVRLLSSVDP